MLIWKQFSNRICLTVKKLDANGNSTDAGNNQYMFVLTILGKIKETKSKFFQGSVTVLSKIAY